MEKNSSSAFGLYLHFFGSTLLVLLLLRLVFFIFIHFQTPEGLSSAPSADIIKALYLGGRFDARIAALFTLPPGIILSLPWLNRRLRNWSNTIFFVYFPLFLLLWCIYGLDFGFYSYLGVRLNATLLDLLADFRVAADMFWESYHAIPLICGLLTTAAGSALLFRRFAQRPVKSLSKGFKPVMAWIGAFFIFALAAYGQLSSNLFPLRWSNAYFSANQTVSALALNPVQNLVDTYRSASKPEFNLKKTQTAYPLIAEFLKVDHPDAKTLSYTRKTTPPANTFHKRPPNVVIIILESLAFPKTSFAPGSGNPTPNLRLLSGESQLYTKFFANARTTARAVFTTMTGIPDVTESSTGSRNPFAVDQYVIADQFNGYEKFYMLGGNTAWANIRGVLANNVRGLKILEESHWKAPNADVWGVSDWDLLMEAHEEFVTQGDHPFLAVIQTASFHRPYTVPPTTGFTPQKLDEATKNNYGFTGEDEYNSLLYVDHAVGEFFRRAKQSPYYANTIFFIYGDHGLNDKSGNMSASYAQSGLAAWHVPMLIHAPGLLSPTVSDMPCSEVDVFPTAAWLAGLPHENRTLGRSIFDERYNKSRVVYIGGQSNTPNHLVLGDFCFVDNRVGVQTLYNLNDTPVKDHKDTAPPLFNQMRDLTNALHQTARYMLFNNKKDK